MFKSVGYTWNPLAGCDHDCPYCYAKMLMLRWGKSFEPDVRLSFYNDKLPDDGTWIFVGSMGDSFCYGFDDSDIATLLEHIAKYEGSNKFLLQTKRPTRMIEFLKLLVPIKDKVIIGTTLETNRETLGKAPPTIQRMGAMVAFNAMGFKTFLSLEPLCDFDPVLIDWVININPEAVEIGLENYTNFTERPSEEKIKELLNALRYRNIEYVLKENVEHLETKNTESDKTTYMGGPWSKALQAMSARENRLKAAEEKEREACEKSG